MAALPYMQFYVADYLADTMHLTTEEHGAYLLLIFNYWQTGKPLPNDDKRLSNIAKIPNERWTDVKRSLNEYFVIVGDTLVHPRIEADLKFIEDKQNKAVMAGKASAIARKEKNRIKTSTRSTDVTTYVATNVDTSVPAEGQRKGNHSDSDTDSDTDKKKRVEKRTKKNPAFLIPDFINLISWQEFEQHRKEIKKPLTDLARKKATNLLIGLSHEQQKRVIDYSINGSYPGLYPEKAEHGNERNNQVTKNQQNDKQKTNRDRHNEIGSIIDRQLDDAVAGELDGRVI